MRARVVQAMLASLILASGDWNLRATEPDQSAESEAPLVGVFYDLKQTPDHKPLATSTDTFNKIIDEFLSKDWDESVLNRFYRTTAPYRTTQIFIPMAGSGQAPATFGVEKRVKPDFWLMYYKAQVSAPEDGTYRFVAGGDDFIAVGVNGKTELAAPLRDPETKLLPLTKWKSSDLAAPQVGTTWQYYCCNGDWIEMKKGKPIDLDVIFGDGPDGLYSAFVLVQEKGKTYKMDAQNRPILPIFQVAPYDTPLPPSNMAPQFAKGYPTWKCYQ